MQKILLCLDGSQLSKSVCDYGIYISKQLDLPLLLLNVVEHSHFSNKTDLSGSIGLGAKDDLLDEFTQEEMSQSKKLISKGRTILKEYEKYVLQNGITNVETLQKHGTLDDTLKDLSINIRIAIIGLKGDNHPEKEIGSNIEELIRSVNIPILLVNSLFSPIKSILMAYDGNDYSKKAINIATQNPIFPNVKRFIVNVNKDLSTSHNLLAQSKELFAKRDIEVETYSLNGEPVESLLKFQEEKDIDIIAMGAYGQNRFKSAIFGSFTTKMFLKAKKPLLLFR